MTEYAIITWLCIFLWFAIAYIIDLKTENISLRDEVKFHKNNYNNIDAWEILTTLWFCGLINFKKISKNAWESVTTDDNFIIKVQKKYQPNSFRKWLITIEIYINLNWEKVIIMHAFDVVWLRPCREWPRISDFYKWYEGKYLQAFEENRKINDIEENIFSENWLKLKNKK